MYDEAQLNMLQGKEKQHAIEVGKTHAIVTDIQHFKKVWPSELSAIANFATLENVDLLAYAAKSCLIADKFSESSHEQFCSNLSLLAKSFSGLNTRNGCFSSKCIRWRSEMEKTTFSVVLGVVSTIFEVFEKKMKELNGQKAFYMWWRRQLVDASSLEKIKSFKTLDLSASNEFTCNFENGPLGLQFGDGVRKDGEKFVEVLNILPGGQAAKYTELRDGDVIVRVGQSTSVVWTLTT